MAANTSARASSAEYSAAGRGTSVSVSHSRSCTAPLAATCSRTTTVPTHGGSSPSSCALRRRWGRAGVRRHTRLPPFRLRCLQRVLSYAPGAAASLPDRHTLEHSTPDGRPLRRCHRQLGAKAPNARRRRLLAQQCRRDSGARLRQGLHRPAQRLRGGLLRQRACAPGKLMQHPCRVAPCQPAYHLRLPTGCADSSASLVMCAPNSVTLRTQRPQLERPQPECCGLTGCAASLHRAGAVDVSQALVHVLKPWRLNSDAPLKKGVGSVNQPVTTRRPRRGSRVPATARTPCGSRGSNRVSRLNAGSTAVTCSPASIQLTHAGERLAVRCSSVCAPCRLAPGEHATGAPVELRRGQCMRHRRCAGTCQEAVIMS